MLGMKERVNTILKWESLTDADKLAKLQKFYQALLIAPDLPDRSTLLDDVRNDMQVLKKKIDASKIIACRD